MNKAEKEVRFAALYAVMEEALARGESVTFAPSGISMRPMLRAGRDRVVLAPIDAPLRRGDVVLYRRPFGQFVLHRIVGGTADGWKLRGDNQWQSEYPVREEQMLARMSGWYRGTRWIAAGGGIDRAYRVIALPLCLLRRVVGRLVRPFRRKS